MNEELDYAEMLEIPVETMTVEKKPPRRKLHLKKQRNADLRDQVVDSVNERMEQPDPYYAESVAIERDAIASKPKNRASIILWSEFAAACVLCAVIFLTNIFVPESAINTFVKGLFTGTATADLRTYSDFRLSPVVSDYTQADITVSETGILSFTAKCSVYSPCSGTLQAVKGSKESGYTVEIKHSEKFSTIMSGLDSVYLAEGDTVRSNLPLAYSDGEGEVRVMFYSEGTLITNYTVSDNNISWS